MAITYSEDNPGELDAYLDNIMRWTAQGARIGLTYDGPFGASKQTRATSDSHDKKMTLLADRLSADEWNELQNVCRSKKADDEGVQYHGRPAPQRENTQSRGGNNARDPGQMGALGATSAKTASKQYGHDAAAQADFFSRYPEAEPTRVDTMGLPEDTVRHPAPTTADVASFHDLYTKDNG
jgi:hypothetical protein